MRKHPNKAYRKKYVADWNANSPMNLETERLSKRVAAGEKIILMCWCVGASHNRTCHLELVQKKIEEIVENGTQSA